jgi:hypothetical protein
LEKEKYPSAIFVVGNFGGGSTKVIGSKPIWTQWKCSQIWPWFENQRGRKKPKWKFEIYKWFLGSWKKVTRSKIWVATDLPLIWNLGPEIKVAHGLTRDSRLNNVHIPDDHSIGRFVCSNLLIQLRRLWRLVRHLWQVVPIGYVS